ncbi:MAG: type II secretion system protein [Candidatus Shapirobacteria bacterium]
MKSLQKGFTLVELLIVIAIIAVMGAVSLIVLNPLELINRGRDANNLSKAKEVISACDVFRAANDGTFPAGCAALTAGGYLKTCNGLPGGITYTNCTAAVAITSTYYQAAVRCGAIAPATTCSLPGEL